MKPVRGLPIRRSPRNSGNSNPSTPSGERNRDWDRFNNKHTPEEIKFYREKWNEFYPDDPLIPQPKYQKKSTETQKEYLRRMWNVVFPDDQIDWYEEDESQYYGYHRMDEDGRYYNINDEEIDICGRIIEEPIYPK